MDARPRAERGWYAMRTIHLYPKNYRTERGAKYTTNDDLICKKTRKDGIFWERKKNLSRTRRCHQTKVEAPSPIRTPHGHHPPPRGAVLQAVDALHALPPSDIRQAWHAPAPMITRIEQSAIIVFGPFPDDVDLVTRNRLLEELIDRPKYVSRRDLPVVLPNPDRWPHILAP